MHIQTQLRTTWMLYLLFFLHLMWFDFPVPFFFFQFSIRKYFKSLLWRFVTKRHFEVDAEIFVFISSQVELQRIANFCNTTLQFSG